MHVMAKGIDRAMVSSHRCFDLQLHKFKTPTETSERNVLRLNIAGKRKRIKALRMKYWLNFLAQEQTHFLRCGAFICISRKHQNRASETGFPFRVTEVFY